MDGNPSLSDHRRVGASADMMEHHRHWNECVGNLHGDAVRASIVSDSVQLDVVGDKGVMDAIAINVDIGNCDHIVDVSVSLIGALQANYSAQ